MGPVSPLEMDASLPFPVGFMDKNPNPGMHDCDHGDYYEPCDEESVVGYCGEHPGWCRHWLVLEYDTEHERWDTDTWRGQLKEVLPHGISFIFTGVEQNVGTKRKPHWFYLVYLRLDPLLHRVDWEMISRFERVGDGQPGGIPLSAWPFSLCCWIDSGGTRDDVGKLYTACTGHGSVFYGSEGANHLFGDKYARLLLKQIWYKVRPRMVRLLAEYAKERDQPGDEITDSEEETEDEMD